MIDAVSRRWISRLFGSLLALTLLGGSAFGQATAVETERKVAAVEPAAITEVAMYVSKGTSGKGPEMLTKTFAADETLDLVRITVDDVRAGALDGHRVLIVPGGTSATIGKALGDPGREAIRAFVEDGGIYVGICAGCYLSTCEYPWSLHLLPAKVVDRRNSYRGRAALRLEPTQDGREWMGREDLSPKSVYHNGPVLEALPDVGEKLVPLAYYHEEITRKGAQEGLMVNTPAIAVAAFGKGWVIGISPHPEQTDGLKDVVPALIRRALANPPGE